MSELRVITRALVVAGGAIVLSAAGLMAFAHGKAPARSSDVNVVQGSYCPVRPSGAEHASLARANAEVRMTPVTPAPATVGSSSALGATPLLAPEPALCRPAPDSVQTQSSVHP